MLLALALGCASDKVVPESGAVLITVRCPAGGPVPDELRVWIYDDSGRLWDGVRLPEQGPLVPAGAENLGTILVAPGPIQGGLRIHLRGLLGGLRALDGVLTVGSLVDGDRAFDLLLDTALPPDDDGDNVPDSIDDCVGVANPAQGGCPGPVLPDAAAGGASDAEPESDGSPPSFATDGDLPRDAAPPLSDGGAELFRDVAATSAETGSATPPDAQSTVFEPDSEIAHDAAPASPDDDAARDDGADLEPDGADDATSAQVEASAEGLDLSLDVDAAEPGAGADAAPGDGPEVAAAATDSPGCGDACGKRQGASCETNEECASGACADGVCCTNACIGPCRSCNQPSSNGTCQGYQAGSDPEGECQDGNLCNGAGACGPPPSNLPNGQLCASSGQCRSGFCADGVCCNSDCTTPCMACGTGICLAVTGADDVPECTGSKTCNPKGKCVTN
jgi:hypothetical protein